MASRLIETFQNHVVAPFSGLGAKKGQQNHSLLITVAAVACAVLPFDTLQLAIMLLGAIAYAVLQQSRSAAARKPALPKSKVPIVPCSTIAAAKFSCTGPAPQANVSCRQTAKPRRAAIAEPVKQIVQRLPPCPQEPLQQKPIAKTDLRTPSAVPVIAPTFSACEWDGQVSELLQSLLPTPEGNKAIQELAQLVKLLLQKILPEEAEVIGYACSSFTGRQAFAVAVPEVDIVLNISPAALQNYMHGSKGSQQAKDPYKLHKAAIRSCVSHLVSVGRFKFRRSAFKSNEPKVTLLAPDSFAAKYGLLEQGIPIDFSINAATPLCNAALVMEYKQLQPVSRDLILLVKRWAKHRGICHVAKGHLPPYAWSILCVHFLQVGAGKRPALLPGSETLRCSAGLMKDARAQPRVEEPVKCQEHDGTAGELLKEFFEFYRSFKWQGQQVSIRSTPQKGSLAAAGAAKAYIEDPFDATCNVGACLSEGSFQRLLEEFNRAHSLVGSGASLTELLEPWAPPIAEAAAGESSDKE